MATATIVQAWTFATSGAGTPATQSVNLPGGAATAGNTLLVAATGDATIATPSGYTSVQSSVHNAGMYLFAKIADGSETGVTVTPSVSAAVCVGIAEIGNLTGALITDRIDQTATNGTSSGVASRSTGTTGTTAQNDEYAVALIGYSASQVVLPNGGSNQLASFSNSFAEVSGGDVGTTKGTGTNVGLCVATKDLSATGTVETTGTYATIVSSTEALVATFKVAAGSAVSANAALTVTATEAATVTATRAADAALAVTASETATATANRAANAALTVSATEAATASLATSTSAARAVTATLSATMTIGAVQLAAAPLAVTATLTATMALNSESAGGWYSLLSIYRDSIAEAAYYRDARPTACPNDGEPLSVGPRGELHCRYDGYIWQN